jgi:hypothetical protein
MKIILTERQQNLITENLTDENLRKFCYQIWNKQFEQINSILLVAEKN